MVQTENNAMTEVALALAMAFFAIFVLAAVSMSQPSLARLKLDEAINAEPEKVVHELAIKTDAPGERALEKEETFLVYFQQAFFDAQLKPFQFKQDSSSKMDKFVVGVLPSLSMGDMLEIKNQKKFPNLSITILNAEWQQRLELLR
jgi:hypothetical protein